MPNPGPASNIVTESMLQIGSVNFPARSIFPSVNLTALTAMGNGTMSFQYMPVGDNMTASRMDALFGWAVGSTTTTNTFGLAFTAIAGIYSNTVFGSGTATTQGMTALTTGSATQSYSVASQGSGQTQLFQSAVRPVSVPMNINLYPGEYIVGFALSTNTSSVGAATTALGQTISVYGGTGWQTAVNAVAEFGNATAVTSGLWSPMGVHSVTQSYPAASYAQSDISGTGAPLANACIALVFRNT